jgi:sarcosine oxidase subunit delta
MSFLLTCPNCGARDIGEFRYGGQILPAAGGGNLPGLQRERWYHRLGCGRWLAAERDIRTNSVIATRWLDQEDS